MTKSEASMRMGLMRMAEWAQSWVENETCVPEVPFSQLEPRDVAALALIGAVLEAKKD